MKKNICILLCVAMVLAFSACGLIRGNSDTAALLARIDELEAQLASSTPAVTQSTGGTSAPVTQVQHVLALNALVYPEGGDAAAAASAMEITEPTTIVAVPVLPEGKAVDHWEINGQEVAAAENQAMVFVVEQPTFLKAVLRDELKVTSINANMRFLDDRGNPRGDPFYEYIFEYDDENVSSKRISVHVTAEVPSGYAVDYWKINNVPYYFSKAVSAFTAENLYESTVYEVVFKKVNSTPSPSTPATPAPRSPSPSATPNNSLVLPSFSAPIISMPPFSFIPIPTPTPTPRPIG